MTNERLKEILLNTKICGKKLITKKYLNILNTKYEFYFLKRDGMNIGVILDMNNEPHIFVLEEYRKMGYGSYLLAYYIEEKTKNYKYVIYKGESDKLIKKALNNLFGYYIYFLVADNEEEKTYFIINDSRIKTLKDKL